MKPQRYVNDFANVLSPSTRTRITQLCTEVDQKAQAQIAVVTVRTLNGQSAFDYSFKLATRWGVGPKQKDRGVLILVAIGDHKYFAQIGYGLEGILPDGKVGGFWREAVPYFRQNNYDAGILLMTERVAGVIVADRGISLTSPPAVEVPQPEAAAASPSSEQSIPGGIIEFILFLVFVILISKFWTGLFFRRYGLTRGRPFGRNYWVGPMIGGFGGGFRGGGWGGGAGGGGFGGFGGGSFGGGGAGGSW